MSIAVSAVIRPSRLALGMIGTIFVATVVIALSIGAGYIGELSFAARSAIVVACVAAGMSALYSTRQIRKTRHIDISGIGQIRLVEDSALAAPSFLASDFQGRRIGEVLSLLEDSTLWSFLLLLRLKGEGNRIRTLIVLPDSVDIGTFRMLSVACRWVAAHGDPD